jgi:mannose-6-phosphate isomerase-like protein (cupin superfamily)
MKADFLTKGCGETAASAAHAHDYDEYMIVVQGRYTLVINGERIPVKAGEEYFIPRGVPHGGKVLAGTERSTHLAAIEQTAAVTPNAPLNFTMRLSRRLAAIGV